jgi:hypothetical protein
MEYDLRRILHGWWDEFRCGAFVQLKDRSYYYKRWSSCLHLPFTLSSHVGFGQRRYPFQDGELLVGYNQTGTWFQLERSSLLTPIGHTLDYIQSTVEECNVGPDGISRYTQSNPLHIEQVSSSPLQSRQ